MAKINQSFPLDLLLCEEEQTLYNNDEVITRMKQLIHNSISKIDIDLCDGSCIVGPTVIRFEFIPNVEIKRSSLRYLEEDLNQVLSEYGPIRLIAPDEEKNALAIEVVRPDRQIVSLRSVLDSEEFQESKAKLPIAFGISSENKPIVKDFFWMVDLLIVGMAGTEKSVLLHNIIMSLIYAKRPEQLKFILIDTSKREFSHYYKLQFSYLATFDDKPAVITKSEDVLRVLDALIYEQEKRSEIQYQANVPFIWNDLQQPSIVVIIDEIADLIRRFGDQLKFRLYRLLGYGKSYGIHFICTSQRVALDVLDDRFIAEFQAHISFKVSTGEDSRRIIEKPDAVSLCDKGDMILYWEESDRFVEGTFKHFERIQGCYHDSCEMINILEYLNSPQTIPYVVSTKAVSFPLDNQSESILKNRFDPLLEDVAWFVVSSHCGSTAQIQRRFEIGYNRASRLLDLLEAEGIVGPDKGMGYRDVFMNQDDFLALKKYNTSKELVDVESSRGWSARLKCRIKSFIKKKNK